MVSLGLDVYVARDPHIASTLSQAYKYMVM